MCRYVFAVSRDGVLWAQVSRGGDVAALMVLIWDPPEHITNTCVCCWNTFIALNKLAFLVSDFRGDVFFYGFVVFRVDADFGTAFDVLKGLRTVILTHV